MGASNHRWRSSRVFVYIVVNLAVFTDAYFYGVIIPVLPFALTDVVKVDESDVQWWIGVLLAAYGAGLLVGSRTCNVPRFLVHVLTAQQAIVGYYADRSESRRGPYLLGLVFLALSTIAISLGRTLEVLVVGRLVQGASSASVHAVGMAILADTASDDGIGPAMGLITTMMSLGAVLGPMFGGLLYHHFGYFAVFLSAYILVAADFVLRILMVEKNSCEMRHDGENYNTFTENQPPASSAQAGDEFDQESNVSRSTSPENSPLLDPSSAHRAFHEKGTIYPILLLLISPRMLAAILCDFIQSLILTGLETVLPLRIKVIFDYNSQDVALVFLILALPYAAGPLTGKIGDIYGAKAVISAGFASLMPLISLLRLVDHYETGQVVLLCVLLFAIGTAMNMVLTPAWSDTTYLVEAKSKEAPEIFGKKGAYAQAFGLLNMAYAIGSVLGPLLGGWLVEEVGWSQLTLGAGILCGVCVIPCILCTGGRVSRKEISLLGSDIDD